VVFLPPFLAVLTWGVGRVNVIIGHLPFAQTFGVTASGNIGSQKINKSGLY